MNKRRILALFVVLILLGSLIACQSQPSEKAGKKTENTAEVEQTEPKKLEIVEDGYSLGDEYANYGIIIKNPNEKLMAEFPKITITMKDAQDKILAVEEQVLGEIYPGQTLAWSGIAGSYNTKPTKVIFELSQSEWNESSKSEYKDFTFSNISIQPLDFETKVTGEIHNPYSEDIKSVHISVLARDSNDKIIGGAGGYVDDLSASSTKPFDIGLYDDSVQALSKVSVYGIRWD